MTRTGRRMRAVVTAVAFGAVLASAGCGGGDDKPSRAEYVASLEEICAESDRRVSRVPEPGSVADVGDYAREVKSVVEELLADARDLELPDEDGERFEEYLDLVEEDPQFRRIDELIEAADAGDEDRVAELGEEIENAGPSEADELAEDLGLEECGSGD